MVHNDASLDYVCPNYVWLNGEIIPQSDAHINCNDRGFRFGDGIFTTIAVLQQAPIFWDLHFSRLQIGLDILSISANIDNIIDAVQAIIHQNNIINGLCRIIITRGNGSKGYLPTNATPPTIYIETQNTTPPIHNIYANQAVRLQLSKWRRPPPNCLPNTSKIMQGMNPILAKIAAINAGYNEALMLSHDDFVSEAASSNIFWLEGEQLLTPPLTTGCLNGVMRQKLLQLGATEKLTTINELCECNGAFLTNCTMGITKIASINDDELRQNHDLIAQLIKKITTQITNEINNFCAK